MPIGDTPEEDAQLRADAEARRRGTTQGQYPQLDGVNLSELSDAERLRLNREGVPVPMQGPRDQSINQGLTFGFSDEIGRAVDTVFRGSEGANARRDLSQRQLQQFRNESPVQAGAIELAAGATTGAGVVRGGRALLGQAAPRVGAAVDAFAAARPGVSAAVGGGVGGSIAGAGYSEDGERVQGAAVGGAAGVLLGPAVRTALGIVSPVANSAVRRFSGGAADSVEDAAGQVSTGARRFMERSGIAREMRQNPDALTGDGSSFVAERLGPRGRQMANFAAGTGDEAQGVAEQAVADRAAGRGARVEAAAGRATQMDDGVRAVDSLMGVDDVRQAAKPLFNEADAQTIRVTPAMREAIRRAHAQGVDFRIADQVAISDDIPGVRLSSYADDIDALPDRMSLGAVRALARTIEAEAKGSFRADNARSALGPGLANTARELRDGLRQSRQYREAAELWTSAARDEEAFEMGASVFKLGAQAERDLRRFVTSGTSQTERRMFLAGVADAIERRTGGAAETGNAASRLNPARIRDRLGRFLGDDAAEELIERLDVENNHAGFENLINRSVNSPTASRTEAMRQGRQAQSGVVREFMASLVDDTGRQLRDLGGLRPLVGRLIRGGNDDDIAEVARFLFEQGDVSKHPLARAIFREAERRGIQIEGLAAGSASAAQGQLQNRNPATASTAR